MASRDYHALPKVELHCHLDGSLSFKTIRRLAELAEVPLPSGDAALASLVQAPPETVDLLSYLKTFDVIRPLLQTPEALRLAAYDVVAQAAAENVRYLELRFAPEFSTDQGLSVTATIQAVLAGIAQAMAAFDIQAKLLVCAMRQAPVAVNTALLEAAAPLLGTGLVGGDCAGNEQDFGTTTLQPVIQQAQALGVPMTLHAGECHCVQNITAALALGITRIGHATALMDQPDAIQAFVKAGATAELCFTSNLQTKAAATPAAFPFNQLRHAHAKLTINTDNRTVSNTTLTAEYQRLDAAFGVTAQEFLAFNLNAAQAAFIPRSAKQALSDRLRHEYAPFL